MTEANNPLGEFLKEARTRKGLSLRAVEEAISVSNAYLSQMESGKVKQPSPIVLYSLSELYGVSYADLMMLAGYPVPTSRKGQVGTRRILARFGTITDEEEAALGEYLRFLRSRRRKEPK